MKECYVYLPNGMTMLEAAEILIKRYKDRRRPAEKLLRTKNRNQAIKILVKKRKWSKEEAEYTVNSIIKGKERRKIIRKMTDYFDREETMKLFDFVEECEKKGLEPIEEFKKLML